MTQWVNFAEIRSKVSLEAVLFTYYGISNLTRQASGELVGPCPLHGGDSPRAFHANLEKNAWHCFTRCKAGGNQLDFVVRKEGVTVREAALRLQEYFLGDTSPPPRSAPTSSQAKAPPPRPAKAGPGRAERSPADGEKSDDGNPPLEITLHLLPDHPHLLETRKLPLDLLNVFEVGYCPRGILAGMIAVPIHDEKGQLVAYAGRRLKPQDIREKGKYKFPKGFRKELVLFNLHRAMQHVASGLILVEGFFSVLKLADVGFLNVVACMGSDLSDAQARLLAGNALECVILMDGDEAGRAGGAAARDKLAALGMRTHLVRLPEDLEPEDLEPRALRWVCNGMRELKLSELSFERVTSASDGTSEGAA